MINIIFNKFKFYDLSEFNVVYKYNIFKLVKVIKFIYKIFYYPQEANNNN